MAGEQISQVVVLKRYYPLFFKQIITHVFYSCRCILRIICTRNVEGIATNKPRFLEIVVGLGLTHETTSCQPNQPIINHEATAVTRNGQVRRRRPVAVHETTSRRRSRRPPSILALRHWGCDGKILQASGHDDHLSSLITRKYQNYSTKILL